MPIPHQAAEILDGLTRYLSRALADGTVVLAAGNADGRVNSQENERQLSHALELFARANEWFGAGGYSLDVAAPRYWYDFCVRGAEGLFLPVNVKVSSFASCDNLSSKKGLFYALTGVIPDAINLNAWEDFCAQLARMIDHATPADYYFLAVNKRAAGDVFWTSLKSLEVLQPNGSNPPYQCNWAQNRNRREREPGEAAAFLLHTLRESFVRGANPLLSFDRHLKEFIEP